MSNPTPDRVTYSETRSISVGDYENRTIFVSIGCDLKGKTAEIRESASEESSESHEKVINRLAAKVGYILDKKEVMVRQTVLDGGYGLTGDEDSYSTKLLDAKKRVKAQQVSKEVKKNKTKA